MRAHATHSQVRRGDSGRSRLCLCFEQLRGRGQGIKDEARQAMLRPSELSKEQARAKGGVGKGWEREAGRAARRARSS